MLLLKDLLPVCDPTPNIIYMSNKNTNTNIDFEIEDIKIDKDIGNLKVIDVYADGGVCITLHFDKVVWHRYKERAR